MSTPEDTPWAGKCKRDGGGGNGGAKRHKREGGSGSKGHGADADLPEHQLLSRLHALTELRPELRGEAAWRIVERWYPNLRQEGRDSALSELLRSHGVPVDLIHDTLLLHDEEKEEERWLQGLSVDDLGGNLSRIPVDVWREHVCPFLADSWSGWAKLARVSRRWFLHLRFPRSLSG